MCSTSYFIYIFSFYFISSASSEYPLLMTTENTDQANKIAECVSKLSTKYFVEKKALGGSLICFNFNSYAPSPMQTALFRVLNNDYSTSLLAKDSAKRHLNASHFPYKVKNYMMILEEKQELRRNLLLLTLLPSWNALAKAVIFYPLKLNEDPEKISKEFINLLRKAKILRSIIIFESLDNEVISYTWRPYSDINCAGKCNSVYILDTCKNNIVNELAPLEEMFPLDMKGCPLITYAVVSEPYVMPPDRKLTNTIFDDAYEFTKGGEISLVKIISHFTNMTLTIRMSKNLEERGNIHPNGTATGAYAFLKNGSADLVIGNIEVTRTLRKWFNPTVIYMQDEMTWCVPKAAEAATWDNLVIIFQWTTWVATFASLIFMGLLFHYLYYVEQNRQVTKWPTKSLLMTLSMLLGWGASFNPKSATFRILIFIWLCFSVTLEIPYESSLRSFLMHPRFEKQISSEADLIQSGIPVGGREIYRSYFESNNASSFYLFRNYKSTTLAEGVKRAALDRNFAVVSSRRQAEYHDQKLGKGEPLIYCFPEGNNLYKYGVVLLARQWFPMLDRFNTIIRSVSENGLINKWNEELLIHTKSGEEAVSDGIVILGVEHLAGAFMLIGFMYVVSIFVFIGELIFGYIEKRKTTKFKPVYKRSLNKSA